MLWPFRKHLLRVSGPSAPGWGKEGAFLAVQLCFFGSQDQTRACLFTTAETQSGRSTLWPAEDPAQHLQASESYRAPVEDKT